MAELTGGGDTAKTLRLLWGEVAPPRRGPRPGLAVADVVAAATAVADSDGLAALTIRRVAERLGVSAMTVYTYVPGKAELLDLMADAAYQAMERADTAGLDWRERLTAVATENRQLCRDHPWMAELYTARPTLGPGLMAKYEHELAAFDGLDLPDVTRDDALTYLLGFVYANARDERAATAATGTDQQWWEQAGPLLARIFDPTAYPRAVRVGAAAGAERGSAYDPAQAYEFGLARVLDGLGELIGQAAASRRRQ
ncbi:TetR family transcriptional regulator [Actinocatenispora thailandica]|uniref:TetR family transcriptional regulator n=1 Tax=Actinocatenispora thailandica TaxID=227318 RepID=A0A7R7DPM6_9ACTN|nr:TetR/AcrR family transcriptional regulator [Actinocatenispora thailandica]BCJ35442.1 TetR family transcriptional regulator [Actinocatenispora thailandica]